MIASLLKSKKVKRGFKMADEKIKIQNFGGIAVLEAEFKQINIFIGPQASGKSITVKLLFFFKNIFWTCFNQF